MDPSTDDINASNMTCYLDERRVCGPDCMSWLTVPMPHEYLNQKQSHCLQLANQTATAAACGAVVRHLPLLIEQVSDLIEQMHKNRRKDDAIRRVSELNMRGPTGP